MRQRTGHDESLGQGEHRVSTAERGAFSYAGCSCGWLGPARRARDTSRTDGAAHIAQQGGHEDTAEGAAEEAAESGDGGVGGDGDEGER